jgi:hypothetical protein
LTTKEMWYPRISRPALPKLQRRQEGKEHDKLICLLQFIF